MSAARTSANRLPEKFGLHVLAGIGAVGLGVAVASGEPAIVGLAVGILVAAVLFAKPLWNLWTILVLGLLFAGVVQIWTGIAGNRVTWGLSVLGFALMASAILRAVVAPRSSQKVPAYVWLALAFMVYAAISGLFLSSSAEEAASGFKRYFQASGVLFAFALLRFSERNIARLKKLMLFVAVLQLPWVLYELLVLVPIRKDLVAAYGVIPIDVVAGTFGATIDRGGAGGEMAAFLLMVATFLLAHHRERSSHLPKGAFVILLVWILAPLFLGETKIILVILPVTFLILYMRDLVRRPHLSIIGVMLAAVLTAAAAFAYLSLSGETVGEQLALDYAYNFGDMGHGTNILNRTSVLTFWARHNGLHDPVSLLFGHGLGSTHEATGGHVGARYIGYGIGLTSASILLWELGVVGLGAFLAPIVLAWFCTARLLKKCESRIDRADVAAIRAVLPVFAIYVFYRSTLLDTISFQIVFASTLGYLAFLARKVTGHRPMDIGHL